MDLLRRLARGLPRRARLICGMSIFLFCRTAQAQATRQSGRRQRTRRTLFARYPVFLFSSRQFAHGASGTAMAAPPRSPTRLIGVSTASLSPSRLAAGQLQSPGLTRLDRVLDLVTEHEAHYRDQVCAFKLTVLTFFNFFICETSCIFTLLSAPSDPLGTPPRRAVQAPCSLRERVSQWRTLGRKRRDLG